MTATLNNALYAVSGAPAATVAVTSPVDLRFEYRDSAGLHAVKEFHLDPTSYIVTFRATVTTGDRALTPAIVWGPAVGDTGEVEQPTSQKARRAALSERQSRPRLTPADIAKQPTYEGDFRYAGVDDNYFMTAALEPGPSKVTFQPVTIPPPAGSTAAPRELVSYTIEPRQRRRAAQVLRRARRTSTC